MAISSKGETATFKLRSNIEDGARGFKHTSNPHLGFATASLESGSANIGDSPLQEALFEATRWLSWYGVGLASADRLPVVVRIPAGPLGSLKCEEALLGMPIFFSLEFGRCRANGSVLTCE